MTTANTAPITDFAGETLPGRDAEILATEYANVDQVIWREDAELIAAALLNHVLPNTAITTYPWVELITAAEGKKPDEIENAIYDVLKGFQQPLQAAIFSYLSLMIRRVATRYQTMKLGAQPSAKKQKRITTRLIESPDPKLKQQIENELIPDRRPAIIKLASAEALLLNWLANHGKFMKSEEDYFYLYHAERRLYDLETERWLAFLHTLTGVNPGSTVFKQMVAAGKTAALNNAEPAPIMKFAHYDKENQILRVSRFDGTVYVLDGTNISEEANGDGPAIFYDFPSWQSYKLEETSYDYLNRIGQLPAWRTEPDLYGWVFQVWIQTLFFTEMCPTRPIIVLLGEKGSGKSMALRLLMRLLFGSYADISGIPDKPDAFAVAAHHYHLYAMDNMDTLSDWMRDKLARISTGATDEYRKLYTSKEMGVIRYRCWLAVTARTPDTLRRDDLADRVIILPLKRIEDDQRGRELDFMDWAERNRNQFWFSLLSQLNNIVAELRNGSIPQASPLRMADWEALGRIISGIAPSKTDIWDRLVDIIKSEQRNFLAEGEVIIEAIEAWLTNPLNMQRWVTARELYVESQDLLFGLNRPDNDWPRSVKSFSRRLNNISDFLIGRFTMGVYEDAHSKTKKFNFPHA